MVSRQRNFTRFRSAVAVAYTCSIAVGSTHGDVVPPSQAKCAVPFSLSSGAIRLGQDNRSRASYAHPVAKMPVVRCGVLIVGGSAGGVAAALGAVRAGAEVYLLAETDWIGGQLTEQGVPPDENDWIENFGSTAAYRQFRDEVRSYYSHTYRLKQGVNGKHLNPGNCWVGPLGYEPKVGLAVLRKMIQPAIAAGRLHVCYRTRATACQMDGAGTTIVQVTARTQDGRSLTFAPRFALDATDLGDLLPLCGREGVDWRVGAESKTQTGEPDAPAVAHPEWTQPFSFPFALSWSPETMRTNLITRPEGYEQIKAQQHFGFHDGAIKQVMTGDTSWWSYRRILATANFDDPRIAHDITLVNADANDYHGTEIARLVRDSYEKRQTFLHQTRRISLAYAYWLQHECPRDEDPTGHKRGYPEFRLCPEVFGTPDGISSVPYIREGRRIVSMHLIRQQDIVVTDMRRHPYQMGARASWMGDTIGLGEYGMDIHTTKHGELHAYAATKPFQIPLGALIPVRITNLLPACKNIGTTHLTNGAYRLHPIEWNIGESAGTLAAYCVQSHQTPRVVYANMAARRELQTCLLKRGVPLCWYIDVPQSHPAFEAVQELAIIGVFKDDSKDLAFHPNAPITPTEWLRWRQAAGHCGTLRFSGTRAAAATALYRAYAGSHILTHRTSPTI